MAFKLHWKHAGVLLVGIWASCVVSSGAEPTQGLVYLAGEVHKVGAVEIPTDGKLTLSQAIILDGGLGDFGSPHQIKILRKMADGTSQTLHADLEEILGGGAPDHETSANLAKDIVMQSGDIIVVSKRQANF